MRRDDERGLRFVLADPEVLRVEPEGPDKRQNREERKEAKRRSHAGKPNSVRRRRAIARSKLKATVDSGETIIPLALALLPESSNLPGGFGRAVLKRLPIWSCSVRGFACHLCCQRRGALLPHLFTIACRSRRTDVSCVFSVPLSVRLPCPGVTRRTALWSSDFPPLRPLHDAVARPRLDRAAIVWPGCGASFLGLSTSDFGLQTPDFGVR